MSKGGGAGKVYFVLYLAVVLELLIIIVERDEAEEGLLNKQKETMQIVESILSQLQSGAGTEGINTRPQDEITILDENRQAALGENVKIRSYRTYYVEVGVNDVSAELRKKDNEDGKEFDKRINKQIQLANVEEIEYQIFYNSSADPNVIPSFPSDSALKLIDMDSFKPDQSTVASEGGDAWVFKAKHKLALDLEKTIIDITSKHNKEALTSNMIQPVYPPELQVHDGAYYNPPDMTPEQAFYYSDTLSMGQTNANKLMKRTFVVNFAPPRQQGWYKLRFTTKNNRILGIRKGVRADNIKDDDKVNIGTVELTVSNLRKVQKGLEQQLEKYNLPNAEMLYNGEPDTYYKFESEIQKGIEQIIKENPVNAQELTSKMRLYGYIATLLAPGQSQNFNQNKATMEFNIRVITPEPQIQDPKIYVIGEDEIYRLDGIAPAFRVGVSGFQEGASSVSGRIISPSGDIGIDFQPVQANGATPPTAVAGSREYVCYAKGDLKVNQPTEYTIELVHSMSGRANKVQLKLVMFPSRIQGDIERFVSETNAKSYYGYPLIFVYTPPSGNKIKADQFKIYFQTDNGQKNRDISGYTLENKDNLQLTSDLKNYSLRIAWIDPVRKQEIDILPKTDFDIKQDQPRIATQFANDRISGSEDRLKITISGINITYPKTGSEKAALINISASAKSNIKNYRASNPKVIYKQGDKSCTIELEVTGSVGDADAIRGTVDVEISATASNPEHSDKVSRTGKGKYTARVNKSLDY